MQSKRNRKLANEKKLADQRLQDDLTLLSKKAQTPEFPPFFKQLLIKHAEALFRNPFQLSKMMLIRAHAEIESLYIDRSKRYFSPERDAMRENTIHMALYCLYLAISSYDSPSIQNLVKEKEAYFKEFFSKYGISFDMDARKQDMIKVEKEKEKIKREKIPVPTTLKMCDDYFKLAQLSMCDDYFKHAQSPVDFSSACIFRAKNYLDRIVKSECYALYLRKEETKVVSFFKKASLSIKEKSQEKPWTFRRLILIIDTVMDAMKPGIEFNSTLKELFIDLEKERERVLSALSDDGRKDYEINRKKQIADKAIIISAEKKISSDKKENNPPTPKKDPKSILITALSLTQKKASQLSATHDTNKIKEALHLNTKAEVLLDEKASLLDTFEWQQKKISILEEKAEIYVLLKEHEKAWETFDELLELKNLETSRREEYILKKGKLSLTIGTIEYLELAFSSLSEILPKMESRLKSDAIETLTSISIKLIGKELQIFKDALRAREKNVETLQSAAKKLDDFYQRISINLPDSDLRQEMQLLLVYYYRTEGNLKQAQHILGNKFSKLHKDHLFQLHLQKVLCLLADQATPTQVLINEINNLSNLPFAPSLLEEKKQEVALQPNLLELYDKLFHFAKILHDGTLQKKDRYLLSIAKSLMKLTKLCPVTPARVDLLSYYQCISLFHLEKLNEALVLAQNQYVTTNIQTSMRALEQQILAKIKQKAAFEQQTKTALALEEQKSYIKTQEVRHQIKKFNEELKSLKTLDEVKTLQVRALSFFEETKVSAKMLAQKEGLLKQIQQSKKIYEKKQETIEKKEELNKEKAVRREQRMAQERENFQTAEKILNDTQQLLADLKLAKELKDPAPYAKTLHEIQQRIRSLQTKMKDKKSKQRPALNLLSIAKKSCTEIETILNEKFIALKKLAEKERHEKEKHKLNLLEEKTKARVEAFEKNLNGPKSLEKLRHQYVEACLTLNAVDTFLKQANQVKDEKALASARRMHTTIEAAALKLKEALKVKKKRNKVELKSHIAPPLEKPLTSLDKMRVRRFQQFFDTLFPKSGENERILYEVRYELYFKNEFEWVTALISELIALKASPAMLSQAVPVAMDTYLNEIKVPHTYKGSINFLIPFEEDMNMQDVCDLLYVFGFKIKNEIHDAHYQNFESTRLRHDGEKIKYHITVAKHKDFLKNNPFKLQRNTILLRPSEIQIEMKESDLEKRTTIQLKNNWQAIFVDKNTEVETLLTKTKEHEIDAPNVFSLTLNKFFLMVFKEEDFAKKHLKLENQGPNLTAALSNYAWIREFLAVRGDLPQFKLTPYKEMLGLLTGDEKRNHFLDERTNNHLTAFISLLIEQHFYQIFNASDLFDLQLCDQLATKLCPFLKAIFKNPSYTAHESGPTNEMFYFAVQYLINNIHLLTQTPTISSNVPLSISPEDLFGYTPHFAFKKKNYNQQFDSFFGIIRGYLLPQVGLFAVATQQSEDTMLVLRTSQGSPGVRY